VPEKTDEQYQLFDDVEHMDASEVGKYQQLFSSRAFEQVHIARQKLIAEMVDFIEASGRVFVERRAPEGKPLNDHATAYASHIVCYEMVKQAMASLAGMKYNILGIPYEEAVAEMFVDMRQLLGNFETQLSEIDLDKIMDDFQSEAREKSKVTFGPTVEKIEKGLPVKGSYYSGGEKPNGEGT
jgi:hypothetical protein